MAALSELTTDAVPAGAVVVSVRGRERVSEPYRVEIFVAVDAERLDAAGGIGAKATLTLRPRDTALQVHGIIAEAEVIDQANAERALVRLVLVPRLHQLGLGRHSRMFTQKAVPDVVSAILTSAGLSGDDVSFRLSGKYAPEEHICQYKESDLQFITRWLEHEGMYYFFEQGDSAEKLVITDDLSFHVASRETPVRYYPELDHDATAGECFRSFSCQKRLVPGKIRLKDHDYAHPALDVSGESSVPLAGSSALVVEHGARFFTPDRAGALAAIRAEERGAGRTVFEGRGVVFKIGAGYLFDLEDHPRAEFNRTYLCTAHDYLVVERATTPELRLTVGAEGSEVYTARAEAIFSDVQYRAPRKTPRPRLGGMESALVDGPGGGPYAQLDDQGRYKVKFGFDESALRDGSASTALRMLQPHAGNPEGFHFPARKGTEVLVAFLAGDPDRPVIAGTVPNASTPSPVTLQNHTRNIAHTGSNNHLEVEDLADGQWIDFRTPPKNTFLHLGTPHDGDSHYIVLNTQGDCLFNIGANQDISVGQNLTEKVKLAVIEKYNTSQTSDVEGPQTTTVKGPVEETYTGGHSTTTSGLVLEMYGAGQKTTVTGGERNEHYNVGQTTLVNTDVRQEFKAAQQVLQTGPSVQLYGATKTSIATGHTSFHYDGSVVELYAKSVMRISGPTSWKVPGGATLFTPTWSITQSNRGLCHDILTEFILRHATGTILSISLGGINASATGVSASLNGYKSSSSLASISAAILQLTVSLVKIEFSGQELVYRIAALALLA